MSRKKPEKKSRGRLGGLSRGIAEKAARNHPVWRWPDVADTLAGQHGVEAVQCLAALMEFRPWMADPGGGRTRWSVVDHARELALSPEELLEIYRIHRWAGDMEWDAVNKCHRPPSARQCLPSGRVWGAPRMQDEELIDSLAQVAVALEDFADCLAHHDECDGAFLDLSVRARLLVAALAYEAERIGIAWEDRLAELNEDFGPMLARHGGHRRPMPDSRAS